MSKRILVTAIFLSIAGTDFAYSAEEINACEKKLQVTEARLKNSFNKIWEEVDSIVGVDFFLVVLKDKNRMPASEGESLTSYYSKLLKAMKQTSVDLKEHGIQLDAKKVKKTEELISQLEKAEKCTQLVSKN